MDQNNSLKKINELLSEIAQNMEYFNNQSEKVYKERKKLNDELSIFKQHIDIIDDKTSLIIKQYESLIERFAVLSEKTDKLIHLLEKITK